MVDGLVEVDDVVLGFGVGAGAETPEPLPPEPQALNSTTVETVARTEAQRKVFCDLFITSFLGYSLM